MVYTTEAIGPDGDLNALLKTGHVQQVSRALDTLVEGERLTRIPTDAIESVLLENVDATYGMSFAVFSSGTLVKYLKERGLSEDSYQDMHAALARGFTKLREGQRPEDYEVDVMRFYLQDFKDHAVVYDPEWFRSICA